jgi:hypothetical protein
MELFFTQRIVHADVGRSVFSKNGEISMKSFVVSAAAAALLLAAPAAFADPPDQHGKHGDKNQGTHDTQQSTSQGSTGTTMSGPQKMDRTTHDHGMTTTTQSPSASYNKAFGKQNDRNDNRGRDNQNNNYNDRNNRDNNRNNDRRDNRNDNNYRGNNRTSVNVHINFNRRNVTAQHHYRWRGGSWRWPSGYRYQR